MALFKILRGTANKIMSGENTTQIHDGWAYFSTDDGKFYIDVDSNPNDQQSDKTPVIGNYVGEPIFQGTDLGTKPANRICINQKLFTYNDYDVLDCGTASLETTSDNLIFNCGTSIL